MDYILDIDGNVETYDDLDQFLEAVSDAALAAAESGERAFKVSVQV